MYFPPQARQQTEVVLVILAKLDSYSQLTPRIRAVGQLLASVCIIFGVRQYLVSVVTVQTWQQNNGINGVQSSCFLPVVSILEYIFTGSCCTLPPYSECSGVPVLFTRPLVDSTGGLVPKLGTAFAKIINICTFITFERRKLNIYFTVPPCERSIFCNRALHFRVVNWCWTFFRCPAKRKKFCA
jgi:hypothetical protein